MESESLPPWQPYQQILFIIASVFQANFSMEVILSILLVVVLLFLSAVVSGSEIAFFSFNAADQEVLKNNGTKKDKQILKILERKKLLLSTILISNNFINVGIIILSNYIISSLFSFGGNNIIEVLVNVVLVTTFLVFFGEVMPKILASKQNFYFARFSLPFIQGFGFVFYPFSFFLSKFGNFLDKNIEKRKVEINLNEIEKAIDLGVDEDTKEKDKTLLKGIVHFGNTTVKQVMKPRVDLFALEKNEDFEVVIEKIKENGYSRVPVYEENIDQIVGVLYIKDLLEYFSENKKFQWQDLLREANFTSEVKKIDDLLREMQESKLHMSIVADEYGGTLGLITLEDILEEVVGDINDEYDTEDKAEYKKNKDGTFIFDGKTSLHAMCKAIDTEIGTFEKEKGVSDTLAGLLLETLGKLPEEGDVLNVNQYEFEVLKVEKNRIKKVHLKIKE